MSKRASFFAAPKPAETPEPASTSTRLQDNAPASQPVTLPAGPQADAPAKTPYPKATTRQGRKAVTVYVEPETKRQLDKMVFEEKAENPDFALQDLMIEAVNALFAKRGLTRLAS